MGRQPGRHGGAGGDQDPGRGPGGPGVSGGVRDPRLAWFGPGGELAGAFPSAGLAVVAEELAGPGRRYPGATDGELAGLVRAWAAAESAAAGHKLALIAEMMRRQDAPWDSAPDGSLPERCGDSLRHELALALACSPQSAEKTAWLARELQARLPAAGALLGDGTLTAAKARAVAEIFQHLSDQDAARAEELIAGRLAGKTYAQVARLAEQAALTVDPDLARRRRQAAQRHGARVQLFRELAGTAGLSGRDLPPDQALAAMAAVVARAADYAASDAFGETPMDVLRAWAYLDKLNDVPAADRIAWAAARDDAEAVNDAGDLARLRAALTAQPGPGGPGIPGDDPGGHGNPCDDPGPDDPGDDSQGYDGPDYGDPGYDDPYGPGDPGDGPGDEGPGGGSGDSGPGDSPGDDSPGAGSGDDGPGGDGPGDGPSDSDPGGSDPRGGSRAPGSRHPAGLAGPAGSGSPPRPADFTVPLRTLLGLASQPGEIHGFGLLDPALAAELAAAAAADIRTRICLVITSAEGYAIAHGCARPHQATRTRATREPGLSSTSRISGAASLVQFPARMILTIPATALPALASPPNPASRAGPANPWNLTPRPGTGLPAGTDATGAGYGTWTLTSPGGVQHAVSLEPVPTIDCDHRFETSAYQPGTRLRHLVQIRDWTCTFPTCNRHARDSDFEHAIPYHKGGRTDACNAGARSRACHRVKQKPGWKLTQPKPGWHQWTTPAGWTHTQEPWRYTA